METGTIYTVGYTSFPNINDFIGILKRNGINVLIDVRSNPHSAYYDAFDKEKIEKALQNYGIFYRNYSREFGARQENQTFYKNGQLSFEDFAKSEQFLEGVNKIKKTLEKGYTPAFMCAEKIPMTCHRAILVSRAFSDAGYDVEHILANGDKQSQQEMEQQMVDCFFPDREQISLFEEPKTMEEYINEAYRYQNEKIGFLEENL